jgi:4-diphosphocytidyl-2-C-methyl-D-erythritol kinase
LDPIGLDLSSFEIVILKPPVSVNTAEAYKNIKPRNPVFNLMGIGNLPVENWKENVVNDFEETVFHRYPQIKLLKETLYELGALFASMSGSGSAVYGIFRRLPTDIHKFVPNAIYNRDNN